MPDGAVLGGHNAQVLWHGLYDTPWHGFYDTPWHGFYDTPWHGFYDTPWHGFYDTPWHGFYDTVSEIAGRGTIALRYRLSVSKNATKRRPALILLVIVSAAGCLALGWWQWERFEAVGGSGQNLGYAFQWPLFAAFVVYAYRKFVQLEDVDPEEAEAEEAAAEPREIPADLLPQRPQAEFDDVNLDVDDPEARQMLEYNDYLAQLAARESDRSTT